MKIRIGDRVRVKRGLFLGEWGTVIQRAFSRVWIVDFGNYRQAMFFGGGLDKPPRYRKFADDKPGTVRRKPAGA